MCGCYSQEFTIRLTTIGILSITTVFLSSHYAPHISYKFYVSLFYEKNIKKEIWLFISGFGIMFAVFSWMQESKIVPHELGWIKGLLALIAGFFYILLSEVLYKTWQQKNKKRANHSFTSMIMKRLRRK